MPQPSCSSLLLLGGQQADLPANDYRLIVQGFERLPALTRAEGDRTRLLGYETGGGRLSFFGIAVTGLDALAEGLCAWELEAGHWTVWQLRAGRPVPVWREAIAWTWFEPGPGGQAPLGEFVAAGDSAWWPGREPPPPQPVALFAHVPFDRGIGAFRDEVELLPADPAWPQGFAVLSAWLRRQLGPELALRIEHYGSTAVPGLPAKPIIDILLEVPSWALARSRLLPCLAAAGWEYWWYSGHLVFFRRRGPMGERDCHLHVAPAGHEVWQGLAFRDYLRAHPEAAARYAALKQRLAGEFRHDREAYTQAKTAFVQEIMRQACG